MTSTRKKTSTRARSKTPPTSSGVNGTPAASASRAALTTPPSKPASRVPAPPTPAADAAPRAEATMPELKKQELLAKVVKQSGIRKRDAKPVVEAMLDVLGQAVAEGRDLDLQPFGKLMQNRSNEKSNARVIFAKIRQSKNTAKAGKEAVAEVAE